MSNHMESQNPERSLICPYKIRPAEEAVPILPPDEKLKNAKKLDANDLVHALGPKGFLQLLNERWIQNPICTHWDPTPIVPFARLKKLFPALRDPVIAGLLRRGEIMNIIAAPKQGKSVVIQNLIMCIISGGDWFGLFKCERGRALVIDNELHPETIVFRTASVAQAFNMPEYDIGQAVDFITLRGCLVDLKKLDAYLRNIKKGFYKLIVLDAFYKFMPEDTDENDNADMAGLYNLLDKYANQLDAAIVVIHHTSKGLQSGREVTDVGAGAGAQSRAADTHLILRPHSEESAVVIDAATRSFPQPKSFCARFKFPKWIHDPDLNPEDIKGSEEKRAREERRAAKQQETQKSEQVKGELAMRIDKPMNKKDIRALGEQLGLEKWSDYLVGQWIDQQIKAGALKQVGDGGGAVGKLFMSTKTESN